MVVIIVGIFISAARVTASALVIVIAAIGCFGRSYGSIAAGVTTVVLSVLSPPGVTTVVLSVLSPLPVLPVLLPPSPFVSPQAVSANADAIVIIKASIMINNFFLFLFLLFFKFFCLLLAVGAITKPFTSFRACRGI